MNDSPSWKEHSVFFNELRQSTSESHQKLEENELSVALLSPAVSVSDYQAYLSKLYGITVACERQVFPSLESVFTDLPARFRSSLIREDLLHTGYSREKMEELTIADFDFFTPAEAAGIMYVLEGSTLGGRMIYKHIHEVLRYDAANGASYFWGYGPETGAMWKSFLSSLGNFADNAGKQRDIISSAIQTFTLIDNWLSEAVTESEK